MGPLGKVGIVFGGYAAAVAAAALAAWTYDLSVSALPYDTSGGMYAGGQMLSALAAFLVVALLPTLAWLWFLRRNERFWSAVAILSIAFAAVGLVAVLLPVVTHSATGNATLVLLSLLGLAQLLGVPLWAIAFLLFALLAPTPRLRTQLFVAVGIELLVGVCAVVHWFVPRPPF